MPASLAQWSGSLPAVRQYIPVRWVSCARQAGAARNDHASRQGRNPAAGTSGG